MSFTEEIKNEIISIPAPTRNGALSLLSAFIRTSGSIVSRGGHYGFEIITENERTAEFFSDLCESFFLLHLNVTEAKFDLMSGRDKLSFGCISEESEKLLEELGIIGLNNDGIVLKFGIDDDLACDEETMINFIRGAFLGGGSCTIPEEETYSRTGYHFEIVFSNKTTAVDFSTILADFEILSKLVSRKESAVVYVKSKEVISDILSIIGCNKCLEKLYGIIELKDRQNNANRATNCSVSNIDKTLTASVNQVRAIEIISETIGLKSLNKALFDVALCRLSDKNASMQELAKRLDITKSCLNHRMRKILDIARSLS